MPSLVRAPVIAVGMKVFKGPFMSRKAASEYTFCGIPFLYKVLGRGGRYLLICLYGTPVVRWRVGLGW